MRTQSYRDQLRESLTRLAAGPNDQVGYLKTLLSYPSVDEIALDLYELALLADQNVREGVLSVSARDAINIVNERLGEMSGQHNARLWTPEALLTAPEWQQIRKQATI